MVDDRNGCIPSIKLTTTPATSATRIGEASPISGPKAVRFVKRERLDSGEVWTFARRSTETLEGVSWQHARADGVRQTFGGDCLCRPVGGLAKPVTMACAVALMLITVISPLVVTAAPQPVVTVLPAETNTHAATHELVQVQMAQVQAPPGQPTAPALGKQNHSVGEAQFEVASVKPVAPLSPEPYIPGVWHGGPGTTDPGRITYSRFGLRGLLVLAYGVQRYQVIGPDWLDSERFDIAATIRPGATKEEVNVMLRNLLTDRFHVSLHHETRDLPVYELTVAKTGAKLKASAVASLPATPEPVRLDKSGVPQLPPGVPAMFFSMRGMTVHLTASTQTVSSLANFLYNSELRVPVIDKTGITGTYDFILDFIPETQPSSVDVSGGAGATGLPSQGGGPDIFVALQEQLGLRLEQKKGPVDVLVVDHADKVPVGN